MYRELKLLAVVPARGGSKGIPLKNIQPVSGIPLVTRVARLVSQLDFIDSAVVSTDSDKIAQLAEKSGLNAPFRRPPSLSGDTIGDYEVLYHALTETEHLTKSTFDAVLMLQPTSPLRTRANIVEALDMFIDGGYDAVWSVSHSDSKNHPLKQLLINDNQISYYDDAGKKIIARQQLQPLYQRNGIVYIISRKCLVEFGNIGGSKTGAYLVNQPSVSIDTLEDIEYIEFIIGKYGDPLNL